MSSTFTNSTRGIIMMMFFHVVVFMVFVIISLVKKKIDPITEQGGENDAKYKEEGQAESDTHFDIGPTVKQTTIYDEDQTIVKIIKRVKKLEIYFFCFFLILGLCVLTGTAKAFSFVNYFFIIISMIVFNIAGVSKKTDNKFLRMFLQNFWLILSFFWFINIWATTPVRHPYIIVDAA